LQTITSLPQRLFIEVSFSRGPCNVAGILDQLKIDGVRMAHCTTKDGQRAEDLAFSREQRSRPARTA